MKIKNQSERPLLWWNYGLFMDHKCIETRNMNLRLICFHPHHYVKSVRIWSYSGPHFPAFGLNTERYTASLRIQSKCGNMPTRITPNTENFNRVHLLSAWCLLKGHTHLTKSAAENVNCLLAKINFQLNANSTSF